MAELKTKENEKSVTDFLNSVEKEQKRNDCFEIARMMAEITKEPAKMWGGAIVGFGSYHYKYDSGHEGDMCMIGFSPRKANIALYVSSKFEKGPELLQKLGKHKKSTGCMYINKLDDIDKGVFKSLIEGAFEYMKEKHKS